LDTKRIDDLHEPRWDNNRGRRQQRLTYPISRYV
jgi:hypothetical protein